MRPLPMTLKRLMRRQKAKQGDKRKLPPGRLRIVAGKWRSRLLPVADVQGLRPTSERIRETLFNWLGDTIAGTRCLDLFAGTGALGFEALSRGAGSVCFVDSSREAVVALRDAATLLDAQACEIVKAKALDFLAASGRPRFDVVFLDPPFSTDQVEDLCRLLLERNCLTPGARVYVEQPKDRELPVLPDGWRVVREKLTGNVRYFLLSVD